MKLCELCDRSFGSQNALNQHFRDSPVHALLYSCEPGTRSLGSRNGLNQHLRDSPVHVLSYNCEPCGRSFRSQGALNQHIRDSSAHLQTPITPLNRFFQSFTGFVYDPTLSPNKSYSYLEKFCGWRRDQEESKQAWNHFQEALNQEFKLWFGAEGDLAAWHSLCRAVRIDPLPKTCLDCEKVANLPISTKTYC